MQDLLSINYYQIDRVDADYLNRIFEICRVFANVNLIIMNLTINQEYWNELKTKLRKKYK